VLKNEEALWRSDREAWEEHLPIEASPENFETHQSMLDVFFSGSKN
jgi:hypothetical protein